MSEEKVVYLPSKAVYAHRYQCECGSEHMIVDLINDAVVIECSHCGVPVAHNNMILVAGWESLDGIA